MKYYRIPLFCLVSAIVCPSAFAQNPTSVEVTNAPTVKIDPAANTVKVDPTANTVKVDPNANVVKAQQVGTYNVSGTVRVAGSSTVVVAGTPSVRVMPVYSPLGRSYR
ncbi:MAG: hypothetical protein WCL39_08880 [Armatimonadota bacterium]